MSASEKVVKAWTNSGRRPDIHWRAQEQLRREWPVLAEAIEELVRETKITP